MMQMGMLCSGVSDDARRSISDAFKGTAATPSTCPGGHQDRPVSHCLSAPAILGQCCLQLPTRDLFNSHRDNSTPFSADPSAWKYPQVLVDHPDPQTWHMQASDRLINSNMGCSDNSCNDIPIPRSGWVPYTYCAHIGIWVLDLYGENVIMDAFNDPRRAGIPRASWRKRVCLE